MTKSDVICIGGAAIDIKYRALVPVVLGTSNPVESRRTFGGVARNVAENLTRLGSRVALVTAVGDDDSGRSIVSHLRKNNIDTNWIIISQQYGTATYAAVLQPDGALALGLADMAIFEIITPSVIGAIADSLSTTSWAFVDCNLSADALQAIVRNARVTRSSLAIDAVSTAKIRRLPADLRGVSLLFLNMDEARAFLDVKISEAVTPEKLATALLHRGAERVVLTSGAGGATIADASGITPVGPIAARVVDATGAGDAFIAATMAGLMAGASFAEAAAFGTASASMTIECAESVHPDLSWDRLRLMLSRSSPPVSE